MLTYILTIAAAIVAYEAVRAIIKEQIVRRISRSALQYINESRIKVDRFKFMNKFIVKKELMNDMEIHEAILEHAKEKNMRIEDAEKLKKIPDDHAVVFVMNHRSNID